MYKMTFNTPNAPKDRTAIEMRARQAPLYARYKSEPDAAMITDHAVTCSEWIGADNPLGGEVMPGGKIENAMAYGVHTAVGGDSDKPVPGEILCAAVAACLDSSIRIVANRFGMVLKRLEVEAVASVDVRGTLRADRDVPVGFQIIDIEVAVEPAAGIRAEQIDMLVRTAEQSCVVLQTLNIRPEITISRAQ